MVVHPPLGHWASATIFATAFWTHILIRDVVQHTVEDADTIKELQQHCGVHPVSRAPLVTVTEQRHGDLINFPPGYMHQVITHRPCVKFAWDLYNMDREGEMVRDVIVGWLITIYKAAPDALGSDYMCFPAFVMRIMRTYGKHLLGQGAANPKFWELIEEDAQ